MEKGAKTQAAYLLSEVGGLSEAERLRRQAQSLMEEELALILERLPLQGEMVDLGCGSGTFAAAVAQARPDVQVLACDADALAIQEARRVYGHLPRLRFEVRPLQAGPPADFKADLALLRLVLMHQKDAVEALGACRPWLQAEGQLYVIEGDDRGIEASPAGPWLQQALDLMQQVQLLRGGDRRRGRDLPGLLEQAGFQPLGSAQTGFDLARLGSDLGPLFLPVVSFYLNEAGRLGLVPGEEGAALIERFRAGFAGAFQKTRVPLFHTWASLKA